MSATSDLLRPVGMLEKLYTARHVLGIYNSVIVTATYTVPLKLEDTTLSNILSAAIPPLLHRHPSLCCYFEGEDTVEPKFKRLETINLEDILQIYSLEQQRSLTQELQKLHDQRWPTEPKPLWKLVVMRGPPVVTDPDIDNTVHIAFVYHHVIGDGLSGIAFHKSLLHELASIEHLDVHATPDTIDTPISTSLIEPIEKLISLPLSWLFLIKQVVQEYAPRWLIGAPSPLWAGLPTKTLDECPLRSRVRLISIPADEVEFLLKESKKHGVTLTSLFTAAIVVVLAEQLPDASSFLGMTPYTLRRVTGISMDEMINQSSGFEMIYASDFLDRIRKASNITQRAESLWDAAGSFHTDLQRELTKCPSDNLVGLLPYVPDYVKYYTKKFGKAREATWELSNLGVVRTSQDAIPGSWRLASMSFTQGAQPLGAAFTINCVSVEDRPLNIAVTWQDSVVQEDMIEAVARTFTGLPSLLQHQDLSSHKNHSSR
ncbi:MAG: hypothetical protein Q9166_000165 [cf. Caloplaca sp. 2 TL-2023]